MKPWILMNEQGNTTFYDVAGFLRTCGPHGGKLEFDTRQEADAAARKVALTQRVHVVCLINTYSPVRSVKVEVT